jgi:hypothetical protein
MEALAARQEQAEAEAEVAPLELHRLVAQAHRQA